MAFSFPDSFVFWLRAWMRLCLAFSVTVQAACSAVHQETRARPDAGKEGADGPRSNEAVPEALLTVIEQHKEGLRRLVEGRNGAMEPKVRRLIVNDQAALLAEFLGRVGWTPPQFCPYMAELLLAQFDIIWDQMGPEDGSPDGRGRDGGEQDDATFFVEDPAAQDPRKWEERALVDLMHSVLFQLKLRHCQSPCAAE